MAYFLLLLSTLLDFSHVKVLVLSYLDDYYLFYLYLAYYLVLLLLISLDLSSLSPVLVHYFLLFYLL